MHRQPTISTDIAIIGGGITGLWLLNRLCQEGFQPVLCERIALGSGQTIASQGMIHGGIKYALGGMLNDASETIAAMPGRWRACLAGRGEIDLSATRILSDHTYMWANGNLGQLGSFLASKLLRGRVELLSRTDFPPFFQSEDFHGRLYRLNELVLDSRSLLQNLATPVSKQILAQKVTAANIKLNPSGGIQFLNFDQFRLQAHTYIFAAGAGNESLLTALAADSRLKQGLPEMQLRPLQQVLVTAAAASQHDIFCHYIDGLNANGPRLTLTTHQLSNSQLIWYVGGQIASEGAELPAQLQIQQVRAELVRAMPWVDLRSAEYHLHRVDRAEPKDQTSAGRDRRRPDDVWLSRHDNTLVCWPIKLTLVPRLGDLVEAELTGHSRNRTAQLTLENSRLARPGVAYPPWENLA